jgi:ribosomal protein S27E
MRGPQHGDEDSMTPNDERPKKFPFADRYEREFVEVACPICGTRRIICLPEESLPKCEICRKEMIIKEILTEGKY